MGVTHSLYIPGSVLLLLCSTDRYQSPGLGYFLLDRGSKCYYHTCIYYLYLLLYS
ncbi:hypothetical protein BDD12DRAFT_814452 [Trichophaea hybrida]|nr:hypothetical protein BDD12DRAFT_814452 [Trichophaea hybrida]